MVNRVILIGNLGRDPEVRRLENGAVVAKFPIATNENYKDKSGAWQTQTEWHDIVVWRTLAERAESTLKKGMGVYIEGKLTHRAWQDQDGNNRRTTEVVGSYFRIISSGSGGKRDGSDAGGGYFPSEDDEIAAPNNSGPVPEEAPNQADDDLPF
ncbi:MAG: single-stranded DNA-binding protein [Phaeodactylibacter sp.]|nr:single-stranded DNA-binding protein [Phaeodactylibacter sp.]MCB9304322.1 single-stranded DNA-binding protein [Lewinellaceae bacterium]HQU57728.1 single-stranded DNA-binding protein [Saprospiraceae bacterium]